MNTNLSLQKVRIGQRISSDEIKIINGKQYDIRQPIPVKYTSVRDRFLNARKNFWVPNEISMIDDKQQWENNVLTESEMWLFKTNISYLTCGDNMVPDNLINTVFQHITSNEMRQYLRHVIFEEANHVESYVYILESLGLDDKGQGQIYELYEDLPDLVEKINWNLNFTINSALTNEPLESPKSISLLLEDLLSYYIFEYIFFPLGFTQIFALARNGKLRNTAEQYQYIMRDEVSGHAENGMWLIKQIIKENPEVWTHKLQLRFLEIIEQAISLEKKHAKLIFPEGGIQGMSIKNYIDFGKFLANNISRQLDLRELYNIKSHPIPWISEYELNQEINFFEGRVKEYQTGTQLDWD